MSGLTLGSPAAHLPIPGAPRLFPGKQPLLLLSPSPTSSRPADLSPNPNLRVSLWGWFSEPPIGPGELSVSVSWTKGPVHRKETRFWESLPTLNPHIRRESLAGPPGRRRGQAPGRGAPVLRFVHTPPRLHGETLEGRVWGSNCPLRGDSWSPQGSLDFHVKESV